MVSGTIKYRSYNQYDKNRLIHLNEAIFAVALSGLVAELRVDIAEFFVEIV